ncbi:MAG TPA: DUF1003 domain-containing protein [Gemmatimonadales bacterium]|jgi:uncharacterized membrane protein|nr:DUF1003 domain-containing protein [Gemmatimonadales bacterium]
MTLTPQELAKRVLRKEWDHLSPRERRVIEAVLNRLPVSRNTEAEFRDARTFGERLADRIAQFGGSWPFIIIFLLALLGWVGLNGYLLATRGRTFDPYPYILLNLFLSMLASLQAPIIMMSQNRQAAKDRLDAAHDYEVNLKAEIEIRRLHEKLDELREKRWEELVQMQREQIEYLRSLVVKGEGEG